MPSTPTTPKPRRKLTTDMGRQMLQRERQRLAREQAALAETLVANAKASNAAHALVQRKVAPADAGIANLVGRIATVLAAEGISARIKVESASKAETMNAWTDFSRIYVKYQVHEDVRLMAATLRALMYHEGGHIRFTVPFAQLGEMAVEIDPTITTARMYHTAWNILEDQRMETAVVSESPRKATYLTALILTEFVASPNGAAANYPVLAWRKYLPRHIRHGARAMFVTRHGVDGDQYATAIENIVDTYVRSTDAAEMYRCVIEMWEMLQVIKPMEIDLEDMGHRMQRAKRYEADDSFLDIPISPDMLGEGFAPEDDDEDDDEVEPDLDQTDPEVAEHLATILSAVMLSPETLIKIRYVLPAPKNAPSDTGESDEANDGVGSFEDPSDDKGDDDFGPSGPVPDTDDDEGADDLDDEDDNSDDETDDDANDGTDNGAGKSDDDDNDRSDEPAQGAGGGSHDDDGSDLEDEDDDDDDEGLSQDDLDAFKDEVDEALESDTTLDQDVQSFQDVVDNRESSLASYVGGVSIDTGATAYAEELAIGIEESFLQATQDSSPAWVEGQRRGMLNVIRYATRQPGEREYFRQWTEADEQGYNISVSLMMDYSGSMGGQVENLAKAGFASKLACQRLGIPCTVTLWDTDAKTLWDASEEAEFLPVIESAGGTDPTVALMDLDNQIHGKAVHLVLIFTDGEWSVGGEDRHAKNMLAAYKAEGRWIIGFGYGHGIAESLRTKGCDEVHGITDLMEIPSFLEQALIDLT